MHALTAAHRTLPFGSVVRVRRSDDGREVQVRINDRGPFFINRVIDLSREAARRIGMLRRGTTEVYVEPIYIPREPNPKWMILVGGFMENQRRKNSPITFMETEQSRKSGRLAWKLRPLSRANQRIES